MAARQRIGELHAYKDRLRRQREIQNLDERIYLDQVADGQSRSGPPFAAGNRDRLPLAQDRDVRQLQIEYERAREAGRGGRRGRRRPPPPAPFHPPRPLRRPVARIELDPDTPRYNPHNDPKVQMLAENHGRQMEFLHGKNKELERQREEIRRRLEELGRRPPAQKDNSHEELLRELREQEERNQRLLDELRRQLMEARRPVNIVRTHEQTSVGRESPKKNFIYPLFYGNSLVAEIVAVRQAYLQNGGNDPDMLAQLAQMQAEAQAIEDAMKNAQQKQPKSSKKTTINANFSSLELENERLQRQLQLLQEQKIIASNRRKDNYREDELEYEIKRMQKEHLRKMYELQREIERLRQEQMVERMRLEMQAQQQPTKIILQQPDAPPPPPPQIVQVPAPIQAAPPQQLQVAPTGGPYVDLNMMDAAPYDQYSFPPVDTTPRRKAMFAKERYYNLNMYEPLPRNDPDSYYQPYVFPPEYNMG